MLRAMHGNVVLVSPTGRGNGGNFEAVLAAQTSCLVPGMYLVGERNGVRDHGVLYTTISRRDARRL